MAGCGFSISEATQNPQKHSLMMELSEISKFTWYLIVDIRRRACSVFTVNKEGLVH